MTSVGTLSRRTALALILTASACGDTITSGNEQAEAAAGTRQAAPNANWVKPILEIKATDGKASVFLNGAEPSTPQTYYTVEVTGSGFAAGADFVTRTFAVALDGSRRQIAFGIGVVPADGSYHAIHSASCPSQIIEYYEAVTSSGITIESKRVVPTC